MKHFYNHNDRYVRISPIYNTRSFFHECRQLELITDNTPFGWISFFKKLFSFERKCAYSYTRSTYKKRFGIIIKILVPEDLNPSHYEEASKKLVNKILDQPLPYAIFLLKEGKAKYFYIAVSERLFLNKEGEVEILAPHDIYKNSKTGKICKKDAANAILYIQKGSIINKSKPLFGNKSSIFKFPSSSSFNNFVKQFKEFCITVFKQCDVKDEESVIFKKYNYSSLKRKELLQAKKINKKIKKIEKELNSFYNGLFLTKEVSHKRVQRRFFDFYRKYNQIIERMSFRYGKVCVKIDVLAKPSELKDSLDLLVRKFHDDIYQLATEIYF